MPEIFLSHPPAIFFCFLVMEWKGETYLIGKRGSYAREACIVSEPDQQLFKSSGPVNISVHWNFCDGKIETRCCRTLTPTYIFFIEQYHNVALISRSWGSLLGSQVPCLSTLFPDTSLQHHDCWTPGSSASQHSACHRANTVPQGSSCSKEIYQGSLGRGLEPSRNRESVGPHPRVKAVVHRLSAAIRTKRLCRNKLNTRPLLVK